MGIGSFIIPTGIGAKIGGYAGDASFIARKIAQKHKLIVNPNVVNAACFSGITDNMLYVEGYCLDSFFKGDLSLELHKKNKIGIIFDKAIPPDVLNVHINTINAMRVVYGINILKYSITDSAVGVEFFINKTGESVGNIKNIETLKRAAEKLINDGVDAIAIVCFFPEDNDENYKNGIGVDPVGGIEAIISHYISHEFMVPCAHAPAFSDINITTEIVNSKCAAEYITPTFLPSILIGLENAPQIRLNKTKNCITINDVDFLILPYDCLGGIPAICFNKLGKKIYVIKENTTQLNVTSEKIGINCDIINTYEELLELL